MRAILSDQYGVPCAVLSEDEGVGVAIGTVTAQQIIDFCKAIEAVFRDGDPEVCYVVQFPGRPMELYTETALRRSCKK